MQHQFVVKIEAIPGRFLSLHMMVKFFCSGYIVFSLLQGCKKVVLLTRLRDELSVRYFTVYWSDGCKEWFPRLSRKYQFMVKLKIQEDFFSSWCSNFFCNVICSPCSSHTNVLFLIRLRVKSYHLLHGIQGIKEWYTRICSNYKFLAAVQMIPKMLKYLGMWLVKIFVAWKRS